MQMSQEMARRVEFSITQITKPLILSVQWAFHRHIQPVEGMSLACMILGWNLSLSDDKAFDTSRSYDALDKLALFVTHDKVASEYAWAVLLWALAFHFLVAYVLSAWSFVRTGGVWDEYDWRTQWSRRLRFGGLTALAGWWSIVTILLAIGNFPGTGWKVYFVLMIWTAWAAVRLAYDFGIAVLPWVPKGLRKYAY